MVLHHVSRGVTVNNLDAFTRTQPEALTPGSAKDLITQPLHEETMRLRPGAPFEERRTVVVGITTTDNDGFSPVVEQVRGPIPKTGAKILEQGLRSPGRPFNSPRHDQPRDDTADRGRTQIDQHINPEGWATRLSWDDEDRWQHAN